MNNPIDNKPPASGSVLEFTDSDSIADQAASWVSKLDGDPSDDIVAAFKVWINQSPEHRQRFEQHMAMWNDMNALTDMVPPEPAVQHGAKVGPELLVWLATITGWRQAVAASVVLILMIGWQLGGNSYATYTTAVGEQKTLQLSDGTSVILNTDTELRVAYSDDRRVVYLNRGEAHFDIAHNPAIPFEVYAGKGKVRAVGTAFSVYLRSDDVEVVVTDGTVEILPKNAPQAIAGVASALPSPAQPPPSQPLQLTEKTTAAPQVSAGNIVTYDRHTAEHIMQSALAEADKRLSWHQGMLVFRSEPLERVIDEVNRYTPLKIVIPEQSVRHIKVGGFFKISDIDSVFEALEKGFDIYADYISDDLVYLVHREK